MIIVVIVALQITATRKHRCSLCEREIGSDGKFLICFKDEVYSFSLGESGVLISKKILMTGGLFAFMLLILLARSHYQSELTWSNMTWQDLMDNCPKNGANPGCKYENDGISILNWKGYVMRVDDNRESMRRFYEHAISIYVKMKPSENDEEHADLLLTGTSSVAYDYFEVLDNLSHGDEIMFNGTIKLMKRAAYVDEGRHLHLLSLNKTGAHDDKIRIFRTDEEKGELGKIQGNGLRV